MKRALLGCLLRLALLPASGADPSPALPVVPIANPEQAGRELAAKLRSTPPAENSEFTGVLNITPRGADARRIPVACTVRLAPGAGAPPAWEAIYQTKAVDQTLPERLRVCFRAGRSNEYFYARGLSASNLPTAGQAAPQTETASASPSDTIIRIANEQAEVPLAGSDFWLADLGLEFLHWPGQRAVKAEMKRGQSCRVLESVNPHPSSTGYARVLSWVDLETDGILQAEAYDRDNKLLKEFSVGSFKKVNGQWQLQDMKIRNVKTGSRTWLEFDLKR